MTPAETVLTLWNRIQSRDWPGMRALLADDLVVDWPESLERISGAAKFVAVQAPSSRKAGAFAC